MRLYILSERNNTRSSLKNTSYYCYKAQLQFAGWLKQHVRRTGFRGQRCLPGGEGESCPGSWHLDKLLERSRCNSVNPPPSWLVALFNKIFILSRFEPLMAEEDCDSIATLENFHFRFPRKYSSRTSTAAGLWFYQHSLEKNLRTLHLAPISNSRLLPHQEESQHYDCISIFLLVLKTPLWTFFK